MRNDDKYNSRHFDDIIVRVDKVKNEYQYTFDNHPPLYSQYIQDVVCGEVVTVEVRTKKSTGQEYFLNAKVK